MENTLLSQIIDNYKNQINLYNQMLDLSVKQVSLLKDNLEDTDNLHSLLTTRKAIMDDIINLNAQNKSMQKELVESLGIKEFVIKNLKGLVEEGKVKELDQVITDMSTLLNRINENDKRNEALIKQGFRKNTGKNTSPYEASAAYKKAMQKE